MKTYTRYIIFILTTLILNFSWALADEMICPPLKPSVSGADELRIHEKEFRFRKALSGLNFLQTDIYEIIKESDEETFKLIRENKVPKDMPLELLSVLSNERFYIGYPNNITIIKGTLLKYRILYLREKMNNAAMSKKALKIEYETVRKEFCKFVAEAEYVD